MKQHAGRISVDKLARAIAKVHAMSMEQKVELVNEIKQEQPNMLASCLVQQRFGASMESLDVLLNILLVCFQAMRESGHIWPLITEDEQERQLSRLVGSVLFSENLTDPTLADAARSDYVANHPEAPLFAFVVNEMRQWLLQQARYGAETESDKYFMMAAVNFVNCIAHAPCTERA